LFHETATVQLPEAALPDAAADPLAAALSLAAAELGADVAAPPPLLVQAASARTLLSESATMRRFDMLTLLLWVAPSSTRRRARLLR
jgi:hypothetical protein